MVGEQPDQTKLDQTKLDQTKPDQLDKQPNQTRPNQTKPTRQATKPDQTRPTPSHPLSPLRQVAQLESCTECAALTKQVVAGPVSGKKAEKRRKALEALAPSRGGKTKIKTPAAGGNKKTALRFKLLFDVQLFSVFFLFSFFTSSLEALRFFFLVAKRL